MLSVIFYLYGTNIFHTMKNIDETDRQLLSILQDNSQVTLCKVCCVDMDAYHAMLVGRFSHIENVGALHSIFVLNEIKVTHRLPAL